MKYYTWFSNGHFALTGEPLSVTAPSRRISSRSLRILAVVPSGRRAVVSITLDVFARVLILLITLALFGNSVAYATCGKPQIKALNSKKTSTEKSLSSLNGKLAKEQNRCNSVLSKANLKLAQLQAALVACGTRSGQARCEARVQSSIRSATRQRSSSESLCNSRIAGFASQISNLSARLESVVASLRACGALPPAPTNPGLPAGPTPPANPPPEPPSTQLDPLLKDWWRKPYYDQTADGAQPGEVCMKELFKRITIPGVDTSLDPESIDTGPEPGVLANLTPDEWAGVFVAELKKAIQRAKARPIRLTPDEYDICRYSQELPLASIVFDTTVANGGLGSWEQNTVVFGLPIDQTTRNVLDPRTPYAIFLHEFSHVLRGRPMILADGSDIFEIVKSELYNDNAKLFAYIIPSQSLYQPQVAIRELDADMFSAAAFFFDAGTDVRANVDPTDDLSGVRYEVGDNFKRAYIMLERSYRSVIENLYKPAGVVAESDVPSLTYRQIYHYTRRLSNLGQIGQFDYPDFESGSYVAFSDSVKASVRHDYPN